MRIAVIGSGIAGSAAAYGLRERANVTVYDCLERLGGHAATVDIDYDGHPISVDTGFIVYNALNYPNLTALFDALGVATEPSRMSFSVSVDDGRLEWCGKGDRPLSGLFAQRGNAVSPVFWLMLKELLRFRAVALADLAPGQLGQETLGEETLGEETLGEETLGEETLGEETLGRYVERYGFSRRFVETVLIPMGAAIWSTSPRAMLDFPAKTFLVFFDNHKLLQRERPPWRTVRGGSRRYVEKLFAAARARARLGSAIVEVRPRNGGVEVADAQGRRDVFDQVVLATNAPLARAILVDAPEAVRRVLEKFRTADNDAYLHRDPRLMPKRRAAWAAWNVLSFANAAAAPVAITYWMNRLQNIDERTPLFVSLNPPRPPDPALTFGSYTFAHPQFDAATRRAQTDLAAIQGRDNIWLCGAWTGYGFHEDGLVSGLAVAEALGGSVPWRRLVAPRPLREAAE